MLEEGCTTYMSPMKVPMSKAPNVLSMGGIWGRPAKGSAGVPVGEVEAAEGEDAVAMAAGGSQHPSLWWCVWCEEDYKYAPTARLGDTGWPLSLGRPECKAPGGSGR